MVPLLGAPAGPGCQHRWFREILRLDFRCGISSPLYLHLPVFNFSFVSHINIESVQGIFHTDPMVVFVLGDVGRRGEAEKEGRFAISAKFEDQRN